MGHEVTVGGLLIAAIVLGVVFIGVAMLLSWLSDVISNMWRH